MSQTLILKLNNIIKILNNTLFKYKLVLNLLINK